MVITLENLPLYFCLSLTLLSYNGAVRAVKLSQIDPKHNKYMCTNNFLIYFYSGGPSPIIFTPSFSRLISVRRLKHPDTSESLNSAALVAAATNILPSSSLSHTALLFPGVGNHR